MFGFLTLVDGKATSVRNRHYTLRNIPEERRAHPLCGESLKSLSRSSPSCESV